MYPDALRHVIEAGLASAWCSVCDHDLDLSIETRLEHVAFMGHAPQYARRNGNILYRMTRG